MRKKIKIKEIIRINYAIFIHNRNKNIYVIEQEACDKLFEKYGYQFVNASTDTKEEFFILQYNNETKEFDLNMEIGKQNLLLELLEYADRVIYEDEISDELKRDIYK